MLSRFLPPGWAADAPLALIAGQGGTHSYPWELVRAAQAKGADLRLIALKGETTEELKGLFSSDNIREVTVGDLGGLLKALRELQTRGVILAGQVTPGRLFKDVFPDLRAVALIASLKEKNAETIFGAICTEIEKAGPKILDARTFMDDQMAQKGWMTPSKEKVSSDALDHAIAIAEKMAALNIGQSVVTRKGTVLAVEAFEGTDQMIQRAGQFDANEKIFIKTEKTKQDYRFDIPIFGLKTLNILLSANVKNVVLKTDGVIIPQKLEVLSQARQAGVGILGY